MRPEFRLSRLASNLDPMTHQDACVLVRDCSLKSSFVAFVVLLPLKGEPRCVYCNAP